MHTQKCNHTLHGHLPVLFYFLSFIYLFMAALGLCCCARAFSICGEQGLLFNAMQQVSSRWLFSLWSMGSRHTGFSGCSTQAQLFLSVWDLPQTRDRTRVPCIGRRMLINGATREVLPVLFTQKCITALFIPITIINKYMFTWHLLFVNLEDTYSLCLQWL